MVLFFFVSALLLLSSSAGATPDDTDSMPVVLPIGARQSVASGSSGGVVASRRRRLFGDGGAANFSLPLEGAIKDYGCVLITVGERKKEKKRHALLFLHHLHLFLLSRLFPSTSSSLLHTHTSYFTTSLLLGTPPKPFSVIVDTGSTLTYVACAGCAASGDCGPRHSSSSGFDTAESATARRVTCGDAERCSCGSRQQCGCEASSSSAAPDSLEASLEGNCTWSRDYAEESSASGRLVADVATLPLVDAGAASKTSAADDKNKKCKGTGMPVEEMELFQGTGKSSFECMVCPELVEHIAKQLERDSLILKQSRKAREERALARK